MQHLAMIACLGRAFISYRPPSVGAAVILIPLPRKFGFRTSARKRVGRVARTNASDQVHISGDDDVEWC